LYPLPKPAPSVPPSISTRKVPYQHFHHHKHQEPSSLCLLHLVDNVDC
jgi:hypothetical protein